MEKTEQNRINNGGNDGVVYDIVFSERISSGLGPREKELVRHLVSGEPTNLELISQRMGIALNTVKSMLGSISEKTANPRGTNKLLVIWHLLQKGFLSLVNHSPTPPAE